MQKTIKFDALTAAEVKARLDAITQNQQVLNTIALTVARMDGAPADAEVRLNEDATGIVVTLKNIEDAEGLPSASTGGKTPGK